jgi:hypothetical protein
MKLRISQEELQQRTLFVGSPMYGGQCYGLYANALLRLGIMASEQGLKFRFTPVFNESLIPRARNTVADEFLRSGMTHFLFIDADIEFTPEDVLTLLALADPNSDKDIVCGLYPKKHICWPKIKAAVEQGFEADQLEEFVGEMVLNPIGLEGSYSLYEPLTVSECGTGFMLIQRHVLERFMEAYPDLSYISEKGRQACFFDTAIDPESGRYLSEDYNFCRLVRALGMKIWVAPWLNLNHLGYYRFKGNAGAVSTLAVPQVSAAMAAEV